MAPRGVRNNNPLNIRKGNNWQGERQPQTDAQFEEFVSMLMGLRAGFIIIRNYMRRRPPLDTVAKIISAWAPSTENDTQRYIDFVCKRGSLEPNERLLYSYKQKLCRMVWAMCQMECGEIVSFGLIENAYEYART